EMVTGKLPFERDTPLATAAARLEQPAPSARTHAPELPAAWDAAIARCLRRDPDDRFARAGDVAAALVRRAPMRWRQIAIAGGADRTTIVGTGEFDARPIGGTMSNAKWQATLVAGDVARTVEIADLALEPGLPQPANGSVGIACTRGGVTKAHGLAIGPSYGSGIIVGTETIPRPSACNLDLAD